MAFVFKENRNLQAISPGVDQLEKMDQTSLWKLEKIIHKQLLPPLTQNSQAKLPRHPLQNFKQFVHHLQSNTQIMEMFLRESKKNQREQKENRYRLLQQLPVNHLQDRVKTTAHIQKTNNKQRVIMSRTENKLGPGSYNLGSSLNKNSLVKYHSKQKEQEQESNSIQANNTRKVELNASSLPGPGQYNPNDNRKIVCKVKYVQKQSEFARPQEASLNPMKQIDSYDTSSVFTNHKCMPSPTFRGASVGNSHVSSLLEKIVKKKKTQSKKGLSVKPNDEEYQQLQNRSPGPGSYQVSHQPRSAQNLKNIFISQAPRGVLDTSKKIHTDNKKELIGNVYAPVDEENPNKKQDLCRKIQYIKRQKSLPPFLFSETRFLKTLPPQCNDILQYSCKDELLKKKNVFSKDYFGSHQNRFNYSSTMPTNPAPGHYADAQSLTTKPRSVLLSYSQQRKGLFEIRQTPGPGQYNLVNMQKYPKLNGKSHSPLLRHTKNKYKGQMMGTSQDLNSQDYQDVKGLILSNQQIYERQQQLEQTRKKIKKQTRFKNVFPRVKDNSKRQPLKDQAQGQSNTKVSPCQASNDWEKKSFNVNFSADHIGANNPIQYR